VQTKKPKKNAIADSVTAIDADTIELARTLRIQSKDDFDLAEMLYAELANHPIARAADVIRAELDHRCPNYAAAWYPRTINKGQVPDRFKFVGRREITREVFEQLSRHPKRAPRILGVELVQRRPTDFPQVRKP